MKNNSSGFLMLLLCFVIVLASSYKFQNPNIQAPTWSFPFFSGAEYVFKKSGWNINMDDYARFVSSSDNERRLFVFSNKDSASLVNYSFMPFGYTYIVWLAKTIMPFFSTINAVICFQVLVHAFSSILILYWLRGSWIYQSVFFLMYAVNPLILHFVTFPFYYFWQFVPSFLIIASLINDIKIRVMLFALVPVSLGLYFVRPSLLFVLVYLFFLLGGRGGWRHALAAVVVFVVLILLSSSASVKPWHTMYVGVGAYENQFIDGLSDANGFSRYKEITGESISTNLRNGNFYNLETRKNYFEIIKNEYLIILNLSPLLVLKNAFLNMVQCFSFGYRVGVPWLQYLSVFFGAVMLLVLCLGRQFWYIGAIVSYSAAFAFYFPPIPAYMFGNYVLLVVGLIGSLKKIKSCRSVGFVGNC